jgi:hypothetical protein
VAVEQGLALQQPEVTVDLTPFLDLTQPQVAVVVDPVQDHKPPVVTAVLGAVLHTTAIP